MDSQGILRILQTIVRNLLDDDDIEFVESTTIKDVPGWDSLSNMQIIVRVEKKFAIEFVASDFEGVATIGDFVRVIAGKLPGK